MNIFRIPDSLPAGELLEPLLDNGDILIERIISRGQTSPPGFWYDQDRDEWVVLLQGQAEISFADGRRIALGAGDTLFLAAHERHRVEYTSADTPCIWLAVHGRLK
jgi:cupin 2 domain-containing protein